MEDIGGRKPGGGEDFRRYQEDALKVPSGALFREGAAFTLSDGRARKRTVEVERRSGAEAMIEGGLSSGEEVIVYPSDAVKEGVKVKRG